MVDSVKGRQELLAPAASYRVRGLTCSRCVGTALDELRVLPGVDQIGVTLVPFGVSLVTIHPLDGATAEEVRAGLRRAGFRIVSRTRTRRRHAPSSAKSLHSSRA